MNRLYRWRGWVLGFLAVILAILPPNKQFVSVSGYLLILTGIILRVESRRDMGEHSRGSTLAAPELVTWGVYSKVRHPLYLSNMSIGCGFALVHLGWQPLVFVFGLLLVLFCVGLAGMEDIFLEKQFGSSFLDWKAGTPAFFPWAFLQKNKEKDHLHERKTFFTAFIADRWTWIWILFYSLMLVMRGIVGPFPGITS